MQDEAECGGSGVPGRLGAGGAIIVSFPTQPNRRKAPPDSPKPDLARALGRLEQALAEQRDAIVAWRDANAALAASLITLGDAFAKLDSGLATVTTRSADPAPAALQL